MQFRFRTKLLAVAAVCLISFCLGRGVRQRSSVVLLNCTGQSDIDFRNAAIALARRTTFPRGSDLVIVDAQYREPGAKINTRAVPHNFVRAVYVVRDLTTGKELWVDFDDIVGNTSFVDWTTGK